MNLNIKIMLTFALVMQGCSSYQAVNYTTNKRITGVIDSVTDHKSRYGNKWAHIGSKRLHFWSNPKPGDTVNIYVKRMMR